MKKHPSPRGLIAPTSRAVAAIRHSLLSPGVLAAALLCLAAGHAHAVIRFVDQAATGTGDGLSWFNAETKLQDALAAAMPGDIIAVATGIYYPDEGTGQTDNDRSSTFQLKNGVIILGGYSTGGALFDPATYETTLSGDLFKNDGPGFANNADNAYHVLTGSGTNFSAHLDGFTISAGNSNAISPNDRGGALLNEGSGSPTLTNCAFQGNYASSIGGAIFNQTSSSPALSNCSFQGNNSSNGGAIFNDGSSSPSLTNCSFQGNSSSSPGGAIYNNNNSSPALSNCSFQGNNAVVGGAIYNNNNSSPALTNCIIWNNAENGSTTAPGASVANSNSTPTYSHCLVANLNPPGSNNLDGTNPANNPLFLAEVDPFSAPVTGGDLRLGFDSPALDVGLNSATTTDLAGNPRIFNTTIDLGAFEQQGTLYVGQSAGGSNNGTSWPHAYTKLQDALAAATSGQQILVATGTYYPDEGSGQTNDARSSTFTLKSGVAILGGFPTGGGTRDPDAHPTTLSGDLDQNDGPGFANNAGNAYHVLTGSGTNATALLDGFTISAGNADGTFPNSGGGGLYNNAGSPTLTNCSFQGNNASNGGAIQNFSSSPALTNCSFQGNNASQGGAIRNDSSSPTLINCSFQGNNASNGGGAIYNDSSSSPALINCSFQGNDASNAGGAIFNDGSSSPTLTNCSFQANNASNGGAIYNISSSDPTLTNCSFQGNNASLGGAIFNSSSSPTLTNCIIWNNREGTSTTAPGASVANFSSSIPTYSHCLVANYSKATLDATGTNNLDGTDPANNPLFLLEVDPASAPTTGGDLRLLAPSPALDVGDNTANSTLTDLAGNARIQNTTIDLGAFEGSFNGLLVDASATTGANNGTSWANAFTKLQDALAAATSGQQILVATGTYYPDEGSGQTNNNRSSTFTLKSGVAILGGFPAGGGPRDPATHPTILSGDLDKNDGPGFANNAGNAFHVLTGSGTDNTALLDGFTISGGNSNAIYPNDRGGALLNDGSGSPTLTNCAFQGNSASAIGGAIFNSLTSPALTNCSFQGNSASNGGAIFNSSSSPTLTNCSFQGNNASFDGGAIHNNNSAPALTNCSFQGNNASSDGGAIYNTSSASPALTNCILWNNAENGNTAAPGASVANNSSTPTYSYCLVANISKATLDGTGTSPNTNFEPTDPLFVLEVDPASAPTTGGDLRLSPDPGSPALNVGDNAANSEPLDLAGNPRIFNTTIDLGAFESSFNDLLVDHSATGTNNGTSWANAFTKLQDALAAATSGQQILVATGTYYPDEGSGQANNARSSTFTLKSGVGILGGFPAGGSSFALRDPATHPTTLSGDLDQNDTTGGDNTNNAHHVLTGTGTDASALLDGFTISGGNADGFSTDQNGGGLYNGGGSPTLTNCSFQGNNAVSWGGAIYNFGSSPALTNCSFQGNNAYQGGAIYNENSSPTLINCSFQGNSASSFGGAIYNDNSSPTLTNCIIWNNQSIGSTANQRASVSGNPGTFSHCLVQNWWVAALGGTNNLDGTNPANNPLFVAEVNPADAPTTGGDLRLGPGSPALDVGLNSANHTPTDLASNPRLAPFLIDLGAYELQQISGFTLSPVRVPVRQVGESSITGWLPALNGLTVQFTTPVTTGTLAFDSPPVVDPDGTLRFTLTAGTTGTATFDLVVTDPSMTFPDSTSQSFTITVQPIHVDASATGANDGSSWADAYPKLQDALAAATSGDDIHVAAGTYYPDEGTVPTENDRTSTFQLKNGVALYGGFPTGGSAFAQRDPATHPTILSGDLDQNDSPNFADNGNNAYRVLTGSGTDNTALLDGFTISGGNANVGFPDSRGGGLFNNPSGSPALTNCSFQGNFALRGGAIYNNNSSSPSLTHCSFQGNSASSSGGAIYNGFSSSPALTNCSFQDNSASGQGGAINNNNSSSSPALTNCSFQGNSASNGGAIYNSSSSPALTNCSFQGNSATGSVGEFGVPGNGGAIYNNNSTAALTNCSFQGNSADVDGNGGAIYNSSSSPTLTNCILWNNAENGSTTVPGASVSNGNSTPTYSHCLVQNWTAAALSDPTNSLDGTTAANDPLFVGGGDLRLGPGSPALDVGDNLANTTSTDLAGNPRIFNTFIDLGAFESDIAPSVFATLFPGLDPDDDDNNNGLTNYHDYAAGADPTAAHDPNTVASISDDLLTIPSRIGVDDVIVFYEMSDTLLSNDWDPMLPGVDYSVSGTSSSGDQLLTTIQILPGAPSEPIMFYRARYDTN